MSQGIIIAIFAIPMVVYSIILHEVMHGYAAYLLGDKTAKVSGRLSFNPIKHIDPFGTVLLPLLLYLTTGFMIGYAKPVPINPHNFDDPENSMMITGAAGPLTNIFIGTFLGLIAKTHFFSGAILNILYIVVAVNFLLAIFNLIPIPPLDGSRIVARFLKGRYKYEYYKLERYGMIVLFFLIILGQRLLFSLIYIILDPILNLFF